MRVMVFGTFDRLHDGHRFVLREGAARGNVIVIVARDKNVEVIKSRRPDESEEMRKAAIEQEFPGFEVYLGDTADFLAPIRTHQPDLLLLGYDQKLPPGIETLPCPTERLPAFHPEIFKSSKLRNDP